MVSTYNDIDSILQDIQTITIYYTPLEQNHVSDITNKNIQETVILHNKENIVLTPFETAIVLTDTIIKENSNFSVKLNQGLITHDVALLTNFNEIPFPFDDKEKKSEHLSLELLNMSNKIILIAENSQIGVLIA